MQETQIRENPLDRKWQLTPVFLPGRSHGQRSLEGYSSEGCKESDMAEDLACMHGTEQRPDAQHLPVDAVSSLTLSHWPHQG